MICPVLMFCSNSLTEHNLSTGAKIAIGVGIAAAIIFIILWFTTGPGSD
jgi:hypothetical protein